MINVMHYEKYMAIIEYDGSSDLFHGRVLGIRDVIEFYGKTTEDLHREFKVSVNDYLAMCAGDKVAPEKPFSGKLTLRVNSEEHRQLTIAASIHNQSLNAWAREVLKGAALRDLN
jgi:predicted HicB family RNase H-like nuclease